MKEEIEFTAGECPKCGTLSLGIVQDGKKIIGCVTCGNNPEGIASKKFADEREI